MQASSMRAEPEQGDMRCLHDSEVKRRAKLAGSWENPVLRNPQRKKNELRVASSCGAMSLQLLVWHIAVAVTAVSVLHAGRNIGAVIIGIGFGAQYTVTIIRTPPQKKKKKSIGNYLGPYSRPESR